MSEVNQVQRRKISELITGNAREETKVLEQQIPQMTRDEAEVIVLPKPLVTKLRAARKRVEDAKKVLSILDVAVETIVEREHAKLPKEHQGRYGDSRLVAIGNYTARQKKNLDKAMASVRQKHNKALAIVESATTVAELNKALKMVGLKDG